jgi:hypothetical protein
LYTCDAPDGDLILIRRYGVDASAYAAMPASVVCRHRVPQFLSMLDLLEAWER